MMNLNWIEVGIKDADQTIVFLHEGLGCIEMWRDYPNELCLRTNSRGIIYDRAGYGKSPGSLIGRKADYLHLAADELQNLAQHFNLENFILYGHSDGGSIALIHAAKYPTNVKALITEAAHAFNEDVTIEGVLAARPLLKEGKMDGLKKYHGQRYGEVFHAWNDIWLDDTFKEWSIEDEIVHILAPNLIIQGEDDQYGTLRQVDRICEITKGKSQNFKPKNCGHAPFKEQREQVLEITSNFINELN
jgi:pimeloyl-ACP methyl ester carboxylesterase